MVYRRWMTIIKPSTKDAQKCSIGVRSGEWAGILTIPFRLLKSVTKRPRWGLALPALGVASGPITFKAWRTSTRRISCLYRYHVWFSLTWYRGVHWWRRSHPLPWPTRHHSRITEAFNLASNDLNPTIVKLAATARQVSKQHLRLLLTIGLTAGHIELILGARRQFLMVCALTFTCIAARNWSLRALVVVNHPGCYSWSTWMCSTVVKFQMETFGGV